MSGGDWGGIVTAGTLFLGMLGTGAWKIIMLILKESHDANKALRQENTELKKRVALLEKKAGGP